MDILFLCHRVPYPPDRGDRITTWHFLQHMLAEGHSVRLGCFREEERDAAAVTFLRSKGAEVEAPMLSRGWRKMWSLRGLLTGEALTIPFFAHGELRAAVDRWCAAKPPDLIYVYSSSMAQYVLGRKGCPKAMHFAELDSDKWLQYATKSGWLGRWIYGREAKKLLAFEDAVARDFDLSIVVSEVERELFTRRIPGVNPEVLPNGVDVDHFRSSGDSERHPHTLVFTGVMDYEPNVDGVQWFADECWPQLKASHPDARFLIVGSRPNAAVKALAQRAGIEVTGRVETTPPYFDRAAVAIAPLRLARGVQNKVLEAMSMGMPVVSTPEAAQGLGDVPAGTLSIHSQPPAMVAAIRELFDSPVRARAEGRAAAEWVRDHFRWQNMYERLDTMLLRLGLPARPQHAPAGRAGDPTASRR
jgi:sugar transferase (PEP-CTERM/EpsH1 system associated)